MITQTLKSFSLFLIAITFITPNISSAQANPVDYNQQPQIRIQNIFIIGSESKRPGDTITGTISLVNKQDFDTSGVYYTISMTGEFVKTSSNLKNIYDTSESIGPFFVPANGKTEVEFSYNLPNYKPTPNSGLTFNTFLKNDFKLGRSYIDFDILGDITPQLILEEVNLNIDEEVFSLDRTLYTYKGEETSLVYIVSNPNTESIKVAPKIEIFNLKDLTKPVAVYNESVFIVSSGDKSTIINSIRTFEDVPGIYRAKVSLLGEDGKAHAIPIDFDYVVDGNFASIESIVVSVENGQIAIKEEVPITINYGGKIIDYRKQKSNSVISKASVFVSIENQEGEVIAKTIREVDLKSVGQLVIPVFAERSTNGYSVKVRISKEGQELDSHVSTYPAGEVDDSVSSLLYIISVIVLLLLVGGLILKNKKGLLVFGLLVLSGILGFGSSVDAFTVVYTIGDSELVPSNIVVDYGNGSNDYQLYNTYYGESTEEYTGEALLTEGYDPISITFDAMEAATPPDTSADKNMEVYFMSNGVPQCSEISCWNFDSSNTNSLSPWSEEPPQASALVPGVCNDSECDQENRDYWANGYSVEDGNSPTSFATGLKAPDRGSGDGYRRLYFLIVNRTTYNTQEDSITGEDCQLADPNCEVVYYEESATLLAYEDIWYWDIDQSGPASCNPTVSDQDLSDGIIEVEWEISPMNERDYPYSCYYSSGCIQSKTFFEDLTAIPLIGKSRDSYIRWSGDLGINPQATGETAYPESVSSSEIGQESICLSYDDYYDSYSSEGVEYVFPENPQFYWEDSDEWLHPLGSCTYLHNGLCDEGGECEVEQEIEIVLPNPLNWGPKITTSYATSSYATAAEGSAEVFLRGFYADLSQSDWTQDDEWVSISCAPVVITEPIDNCANIAGAQDTVPSGFHVYPLPNEVGTNGVTLDDLYCYPVSLATQGSVTLTGSPNPTEIDEDVDWELAFSDNFFQGILNGITYDIPRFITQTWSGDTSDSAYTSGNSQNIINNGTTTSQANIVSQGLDKISTSYSESGSALVAIVVQDSYTSLTESSSVTVSPPVCVEECNPCPTEEICDNEVTIDDPEITTFSIDPLFVNNNDEQCSLSWETNDQTESCELDTPSGIIDLGTATSSAGYLVDIGEYTLRCINYAPEETRAGPLSCILNPDLRESQ